MRARRHIVATALAALVLLGCAAPNEMQEYVGRNVNEVILDRGSPSEIFNLSDGRRAYQWEITKQGYRPAPRPRIGVGIGIGTGHWGGEITTLGTDYVPYSKECHYTLYADQRGNDWIVMGMRRPVSGCA